MEALRQRLARHDQAKEWASHYHAVPQVATWRCSVDSEHSSGETGWALVSARRFHTSRVVGLAAAAALVFGVAAVSSTRSAPETYPVADTATTSLYALHAARGDLAVGSYSRFGWNHPGPLLYQL